MSEQEKKRGRGRPTKFEKGLVAQAELLAQAGLIDTEIAERLGIDVATLYRYKVKYPDFCEALKKGKEFVDNLVQDSLLRKALGYYYDEVIEQDGKPTRVIRKHVAASDTACIFWLKNRQPDKWRDLKAVEVADATERPVIINERRTYIEPKPS